MKVLNSLILSAALTLNFGVAALNDSFAGTFDEVSPAGNVSAEQIEMWRVLAEQGDASAQYNLGFAYLYGMVVEQDRNEAVRWFRKAGNQGHTDAQYAMGIAYFDGEGVEQDVREAIIWFRKVAEKGDVDAQFGLGEAYWHGNGVVQDKREAVRWYRKAAEQGDANAQYALGLAYGTGEGVVEDQRESMRWFRTAANQGSAPAQYQLGFAYLAGDGVAQDKREAVRWFRKVAEQGHLDSQVRLGRAYLVGEGVVQDTREAMRWYRKAAEQGHADAQYNLGMGYLGGKGVIADMREAYIWFSIASENGSEKAVDNFRNTNWRERLSQEEIHSAQKEVMRRKEEIDSESETAHSSRNVADKKNAQHNLDIADGDNENFEQKKENLIREIREELENMDADFLYDFGRIYYYGEGIAKDINESVYWWTKAAEKGHAQAQASLGEMYRKGEGVAQDKSEAVRWYSKAAEQGYAAAQFNLAQLYYHSDGIDQSRREAVFWWRKAAEQGYADAQTNLGFAYANGVGVITNFREAHIWYSIAKANGQEVASDNLRKINWREHLSQAEIRSARKEASRRLDAIENRKKRPNDDVLANTNIAIADIPKRVDTAARVFENTWRSVVVVISGENQGSGVIIRPNIVATNCHVVDSGDNIIVHKAENRRADTETPFAADIRHADSGQDFCLLNVDGLWGVPATVRRYDTLKIGEQVYGLGAPSGLDLSLSDGLVSQLREAGGYRIIQTNAAISPGSSGGGLFDNEGNLIGIMTGKISEESVEGIGFAIPADLALAY